MSTIISPTADHHRFISLRRCCRRSRLCLCLLIRPPSDEECGNGPSPDERGDGRGEQESRDEEDEQRDAGPEQGEEQGAGEGEAGQG